MPSSADAIRSLSDERARLREAHLGGLSGFEVVQGLAAAMDRALLALWAEVSSGEPGVALVALGGYGRSELSPYSDVDLMVLHGGVRDVAAIAGRLFYVLWDAGFQVGHATRTPKDCLRLAAANLEAETSFLEARLVTGDGALFSEFAESSLRLTRKRGTRFLSAAREATRARHAANGHASWLLEPNIKDGAGGLRDLHTMGWMRRAFGTEGALEGDELGALELCAELLHRVRNHLHYTTGRRTDVLLLEHQDPTADFLGYADERGLPVDPFMRDLYGAARTIEHSARTTLAELGAVSGPRSGRVVHDLGGGVLRRGPRIEAASGAVLAERPELPARLYAAAAHSGGWVAAATERRLRRELSALDGSLAWTDEARSAFFDLLRTGDAGALEAFDHVGALVRSLPEWEPVRCRAQHNVYHRYTVDVHAFGSVAALAAMAREDKDPLARDVWRDVGDRDLVLLAGLLHDAGKGLPGDHSEAGERIARSVAQRMELDAGRGETLAWLVRHHLLLVETANRRDINDENLVVETAATIGDAERGRMLYVLSVADGRATGPQAWTPWKAALVAELFTKVLHILERGEVTSRDAMDVVRLRTAELRQALARHPAPAVSAHIAGMPRAYFLAFPTTELIRHFPLMAEHIQGGDVRTHVTKAGEPQVYELTFVAPDRPGLFSVASGALALSGISILSAQVFTRSDGAAIEVFRVTGALDPEIASDRWERVAADVRDALAGRLSLDERLAEKRRAYDTRPSRGKREPPRVVVDNRASDFYSVVDISATDRIGLLYAITSALSDLELDIHLAKVATYAEDVVDAFYVRDLEGQKVTDAGRIEEIERVILAAIGAEFA